MKLMRALFRGFRLGSLFVQQSLDVGKRPERNAQPGSDTGFRFGAAIADDRRERDGGDAVHDPHLGNDIYGYRLKDNWLGYDQLNAGEPDGFHNLIRHYDPQILSEANSFAARLLESTAPLPPQGAGLGRDYLSLIDQGSALCLHGLESSKR